MEEKNRTVWTGARRWSSFIHFERVGVQGRRAMHGGEGLVLDVLPGRHSVEAIVDFSDLPSLKGPNLNDVRADNILRRSLDRPYLHLHFTNNLTMLLLIIFF